MNLAVGLMNEGKRVGLLDADLFGPSIPRMMNLHELPKPPKLNEEKKLIIPVLNYGIKCMSMGFLKPKDENAAGGAIVWRGLMVTKALEQLLHQVHWDPLDILVVDMPPGTGDSQLTVCQNTKLSTAVIITTPQQVSISDADKAIDMFAKMRVPVRECRD